MREQISLDKTLPIMLQRLATLLNEFIEKDIKREELFDPAKVAYYWNILEENLWYQKMEFPVEHRGSLIFRLHDYLKGVLDHFDKERAFRYEDSIIVELATEREVLNYLDEERKRDIRGPRRYDRLDTPIYRPLFATHLEIFMPRLRRCKDNRCRRWFVLPKKYKKEGDRWFALPWKREKEYCCHGHASRHYQKIKRTENPEKCNEDMRKYRAKRKSNPVARKKERSKT